MFGQKSYQYMALLYLFLYDAFIRSSVTRSADFWDRIVEDSYIYSPYSDFCNRTEPVPEKPEWEHLCTAPCSCDVVYCREKSACCPDVLQHRVQKEYVNTSCLYPVVHSEQLDTWNDPRFHVDFPLKMVTGCLSNYTGSELHKQCLIYRNTTNLDNMVPVLSSATGVIYVNRFCAECNDITNYEPFESIFVCSTKMFWPSKWDLLVKDRTPQSQQELIETSLCNYIFRPPNGSTIDDNICSEVVIHACNQTGYWDYFDQFLVEACGAYELPHQSFRNIYCFVCNAPREFTHLSDQNLRINPFCPYMIVSVLQISFYAIIDVDLYRLQEKDFTQPAKTSRDHECGDYPGEAWDPYMDLCRRVYCPVFQALNGSECRSVYSGFEGIYIKVLFHFQEINQTQNFNRKDDEIVGDVLPIIRTEMVSQLSFVDTETLCMVRVYIKESNGLNSTQPAIEFIVSLDWLSHYSRLVPPGVLNLYQPDRIRLGLRNTSGYFQVQVVDSRMDGYVLDKTHARYYKIAQARFGSCGTPIAVSTLIVCKRVNIPTSEYNISDNDLILMNGETLSLPDAYIITIDYTSLCFDDYTAKAGHMRRQYSENETIMERITVILSFVCSLVSIACLCITIVTYMLFVEMRTIPGKINVSLCATLLVAQLFLQFTIDLTQDRIICYAFGVLIHYAWAATILWMNVASFNLFRCFSLKNMSRPPGDFHPSLWLYSIYVYGVPLFLVGANILYRFLVTNGNDFGYGMKLCYISSAVGLLATFVAPAAIVVLANGCFLLITIWRVSKVPKIKRAEMRDRNNILIYLKMSTLTGVCWLFGFLRILSRSDAFEVLFILANASQGLLVMFSFVCNKRVLAYYRRRIHSHYLGQKQNVLHNT